MVDLVLNVDLRALVVISFFVLLLLIGIPVILSIFGWLELKKGKKKRAKIFFILAIVYLIISFGICGGMYTG